MDESETAEQSLARYFEERRGDVSGWKPAGKRPRSRGVTSVFSVRFAQNELEVVQAAAERDAKPISTFIREAALEAARPRTVLELEVKASQPIDTDLFKRALDRTPLSAA